MIQSTRIPYSPQYALNTVLPLVYCSGLMAPLVLDIFGHFWKKQLMFAFSIKYYLAFLFHRCCLFVISQKTFETTSCPSPLLFSKYKFGLLNGHNICNRICRGAESLKAFNLFQENRRGWVALETRSLKIHFGAGFSLCPIQLPAPDFPFSFPLCRYKALIYTKHK